MDLLDLLKRKQVWWELKWWAGNPHTMCPRWIVLLILLKVKNFLTTITPLINYTLMGHRHNKESIFFSSIKLLSMYDTYVI